MITTFGDELTVAFESIESTKNDKESGRGEPFMD
jgi:hypothetical protein